MRLCWPQIWALVRDASLSDLGLARDQYASVHNRKQLRRRQRLQSGW